MHYFIRIFTNEKPELPYDTETAPPLPVKQRGSLSPQCHSPTSAFSQSVDNSFFEAAFSSSSFNMTPLSKSPSSSLSSGLSGSSEDILMCRSNRTETRSNRIETNSTGVSPQSLLMPRFSTYDNMTCMGAGLHQTTNNSTQISLAQRMNSLKFIQMPPPIPSKHGGRSRVQSHYDNVHYDCQLGINMSHSKEMIVKSSSSSQRIIQSHQSGFTQRTELDSLSSAAAAENLRSDSLGAVSFKSAAVISKKSHITVSDSSGTRSASAHSAAASFVAGSTSAENISNPPPLPPKKKFSKYCS